MENALSVIALGDSDRFSTINVPPLEYVNQLQPQCNLLNASIGAMGDEL